MLNSAIASFCVCSSWFVRIYFFAGSLLSQYLISYLVADFKEFLIIFWSVPIFLTILQQSPSIDLMNFVMFIMSFYFNANLESLKLSNLYIRWSLSKIFYGNPSCFSIPFGFDSAYIIIDNIISHCVVYICYRIQSTKKKDLSGSFWATELPSLCT